MSTQVGRISGPLLKDNLLRDGVDLAFETDLLYLTVTDPNAANHKIGIKTDSPTRTLFVNNDIGTDNLIVDNLASIADVYINNQSNIGTVLGDLNLVAGTQVIADRIGAGDLEINDNRIYNTVTNNDIELRPDGAGILKIVNDFNIFGSIHATGNVTLDGNITFGSDYNDNISFFSDINSNIVPDQDITYNLGDQFTKRWKNLYAGFLNGQRISTGGFVIGDIDVGLRQGNIWYVATNGNYANVGNHPNGPFDSLEKALSVAQYGDTVYVYPGIYDELFPLVVPAGVSVVGHDLRNTVIVPDTSSEFEDVFLLNDASTVQNITIKNFYYDSINNKGYAFRFAPGLKVVNRSPYIQNCSVITKGTVTSPSDPLGFLTGDAGKGAYIDGAVADQYTNQASMLFHSATFITPGVDTITMTNGVRVEWLDSFTYFANRGLYALRGTGRLSNDGSTTVYGAEVRSINSASVYGNYGAEADGQDTLMYLINHNFAYIGTGNDSSNDRTLVQQANEVVEINNGQIHYTSFDQSGVLRVGDTFYVDLENGKTSLDITQLTGTAIIGLTFEWQGDIVFVDATRIDVDNLRFKGNDILSLIGPVNIASANNIINLNTNVYMKENLNISNNFSIHGQLNLGNQATDSIVIYPVLDQDINPKTDNSYDLGKNYASWDNFWGRRAHISDVQIDSTLIKSTVSNENLELRANGTGSIWLDEKIRVNENLIYVPTDNIRIEPSSTLDITASTTNINGILHTTGDTSFDSNTTFGNDTSDIVTYKASVNSNIEPQLDSFYSLGDNQRSWNLYVGAVDLDDIEINDNYIRTTASNLNLEFKANGTGSVWLDEKIRVNENLIYTATGNIRIEPATTLDITGNTITNGNLYVTNDVYIDSNTIFGDSSLDTVTYKARVNSNIEPSITNYTLGDTVRSWNLYARNLQLDYDIEINNNYIQTISPNLNLILQANGTGSVEFEKTYFDENRIYTIGTNLAITSSSTLDITASTTNVNGILRVTGNTSFDSNITLGNATSDIVRYKATVNSDIIPKYNNFRTLGDSQRSWNLYTGKILLDEFEFNDNYIQTRTDNTDLILKASGTGAIRVELVDFNENVISTFAGNNLAITSSSTLDITASTTNVNGILHVTGDTSFDSDLTLGNSFLDKTIFIARVDSDIIPMLDNTYDLGDTQRAWNLYTGRLILDDFEFNDNYIRTTTGNTNLILQANGTGAIRVELVDFNENIISTFAGNNLRIEPATTLDIYANTTINGELHVFQDQVIEGDTTFGDTPNDTIAFKGSILSNIEPQLDSVYNLGDSQRSWNLYASQVLLDDIEIQDNYIRTTASNLNLELRASGTGSVQLEQTYFDENKIYTIGNNLAITSATTLDITASTTNVNGKLHVTGNTNLDSNITFGDNPFDTVFYNATVSTNIEPQLDNTYSLGDSQRSWNLYAANLLLDDINIDTNLIQTTNNNLNLVLLASGSGSVQLEQTYFDENRIYTVGSTNLAITSATTLDITASTTNVNGKLAVTGDTSFDSNITFGDNPLDTVSYKATVSTDIIPQLDNVYKLGDSQRSWNLYSSSILLDDIEINDNYIRTTASNLNLEFRASGTGSVQLEKTYFDENRIYTVGTNLAVTSATTLDITASTTNINGKLAVTGDTNFDSDITFGDNPLDNVVYKATVNTNIEPQLDSVYKLGDSQRSWNIYASQILLDDIEIQDNYIRTTASNLNLEFKANGTGAVRAEKVDFNENVISTFAGNNLNITSATTLDITASTTNVNGKLAVTGNTSFDSNITFGNNPLDTVSYKATVNTNIEPQINNVYTLGDSQRGWNLYASSILMDDIEINDNYIRTTASNLNLEFKANGIGAVRVEQVDFNENKISTFAGKNLIIDPATTLDIFSNTNVTGSVSATGNFKFDGSITVGNAPTDTIAFVSQIASDIIPNIDDTYTIGKDSDKWLTLWVNNIYTGGIEINTNYIRTVESNADLELRGNGTGGILTESLRFVDNKIIGFVNNQNIQVDLTGTSILDINSNTSLRIPRGTLADRPLGVRTPGGIRFSTDDNLFTGQTTIRSTFGGVYSQNRLTYAAAEPTSNKINFITPTATAAYIDTSKFWLNGLIVDNIEIQNNTISTTNINLNIIPAGTNTVDIDETRLDDNKFTNLGNNNITIAHTSGQGYLKFDGSYGIVIPSGTNAQRDISPPAGTTRWNTQQGYLEVFIENAWGVASSAGSGLATAEEVKELADLWSLILG